MAPTLPHAVSSLPPEGAAAALGAARQQPEVPSSDEADGLLGERALSKLKWRCRRGLLENDLFIARFFERHESRLTIGQARAMEMLMDLSDPDLLDLLLKRKEPEPELAGAGVADLLRLLRV